MNTAGIPGKMPSSSSQAGGSAALSGGGLAGGGEAPQSNALPQMSGYLLKKSQVGEWQRRWFETNGLFLLYYNNEKMTKLLAALSIPEVGEIAYSGEVEDAKGKGFVFQMEIKSRQLQLRTTSREECDQWVAVLIELRDRMEKKKEVARAAAIAAATAAALAGESSMSTPARQSQAPPEPEMSPYARQSAIFKREATAVWQKAKSRKCMLL